MRLLSGIIIVITIVFGLSFAILNSEVVTINYYIGTQKMPLSLLLLIAFMIGVVVGIVFYIPTLLKLKFKK